MTTTDSRSRSRRTPALVAALTLAIALASPGIAFGHAVVYPKASGPGAYERYVLRVPNERATATTRVELRVPSGVRVTSFAEVPGWTLEVLTDSANRIIGAVWTGSLAPKRFVEFPFVGVNPKEAGKVSWPAFQTYAEGERVEWTGEEGSKTPVSSTTIGAVEPAAASSGAGAPAWASWGALALAMLGLALSLRRPEPGKAS
ncbi:MAG: DUF1775 domain-containing protein [Gemmatimonadetes bacterium]|nr:DUF1775 domain-containing protein [Gemmatimonadota bacterium]